MSTGRPTTRKERIRENYLAGRSSKPYHHTPTLRRSMEEGSEAGPSTEACSRCQSTKINKVYYYYYTIIVQLVQWRSELYNLWSKVTLVYYVLLTLCFKSTTLAHADVLDFFLN